MITFEAFQKLYPDDNIVVRTSIMNMQIGPGNEI